MWDMVKSHLNKIFPQLEQQPSVIIIVVAFASVIALGCYRMDLMRFFQTCQIQAVNSYDTKEKLKEIYRKKDLQIKSLVLRVAQLEEEIDRVQIKSPRQNGADDVMCTLRQYEELIRAVMADNDKFRQEKRVMQEHLGNLEASFKGLLEKYKQAKVVIAGLKDNEKDLRRQVEKYGHILKAMEGKYLEAKSGVVAATKSTPNFKNKK